MIFDSFSTLFGAFLLVHEHLYFWSCNRSSTYWQYKSPPVFPSNRVCLIPFPIILPTTKGNVTSFAPLLNTQS